MSRRTQRLFPLFIVALVATVALAGCARDPAAARDAALSSGDGYFRDKKYAEASLEYRRALQQDPRSAVAYDKLGDAYTALEDPRNALGAYVRASDLAPADISMNLKAGSLLLVARRFQGAKARARNILVKDSQNVAGLVLLGNALAGLQSMDEAVEVAKRAVALDPGRAGLLGNLGVFELARGQVAEAERAFLQAVAVDPSSVSALLSLANLYETTGRMPDAEQALRRALTLDPRSVPANATLATVLMQTGRASQAEPYLKVATDALGTTDATIGLADYYVSVGRTGEAMAVLQRLSATADGYAAGRIRIALIDYASGRHDQAHEGLQEVLRREPANVSAMAFEARLLLGESRFDEALDLIETALETEPRSAQAHFTMGRIQQAKGASEDARKEFLEVLELDPRRSDAQIELSQIHLARREIDSAIRFAQAAVENDSRNMDARLALVRGLTVRPEDAPKADAQLKELLARYPNSADARSLLGLVQLGRNDSAAARRSFERALEIDPDHVEALSGLTTLDAEARRLPAARARIDARLAANQRPSPSLLRLAAKVRMATADVDGAEQALRRIIEIEPTNLQGYSMLGQFYVARGELLDATTAFESLARREPRSVPAQTMLGLLAQARGDTERAQQAYEAALRVDPSSAAAANNLAWLYANGNGSKLDTALRLAQTAHAQAPDSAEIADTLAFVYYKKGMASYAVTLLEQAIQVIPDNPQFHYHLGLVLAQTGDDGKARRALEAALALNLQSQDAAEARRVMANLVY